MLKKILLTIGSILLGANFGVISCISPIYLMTVLVAFPEKDPLDLKAWVITSFISCIACAIGTYIYAYKKRREHESPNLYGMAVSISFSVGALLAAVLLLMFVLDPNSGAPSRFI